MFYAKPHPIKNRYTTHLEDHDICIYVLGKKEKREVQGAASLLMDSYNNNIR